MSCHITKGVSERCIARLLLTLCKEMGGFLPYFTSRQDLEELLTYFKIRYIQPVVEIYIDLQYYSFVVSDNKV